MTINIDNVISTTAGIVQPSGDRLDFTAMVLSQNPSLPLGMVKTFESASLVSDFFGVSTPETQIANKYFNGFDNSTRKPSKISYSFFSPSDTASVIYGAPLDGVDLTTLQGFSGKLTITDETGAVTTTTINLSGATSFSNAVTIINTKVALAHSNAPVGVYDSVRNAFVFTAQTFGAGTFLTFDNTGVSFFADQIGASVFSGATLVSGADAQNLTGTLDTIILSERNWVSLLTVFEPSDTEKVELSEWANNQNSNYLYIGWGVNPNDYDPSNSTDFASVIAPLEHESTAIIHGNMEHAAFMAGTIASIDTNRDNGWITLAYKSQSGLLPTISSTDNAIALEDKKYNFYGDWASRSQNKKMLMHGAMIGRWSWIDDFLGQIYLRSGFQESGLSLLTQIRRLPYNRESYEKLKSVWIGDVIAPALDIGIISAGVALDLTQKVLIDSLTGHDDSGEIVATTGWFLSIEDPTAAARVARETPIIVFVYTSGQAIHRLHIPVFLAQ